MPEIKEVMKLTAEQVEKLSYESARDLLDLVVASLEESKLPLADLMKLWEVGEQIAKVCQAQLQAAAVRLADGLPTESAQ